MARRLRRLGREVTVLGRNEAIGAQLETEGIRFVRGHLEDMATVTEAIQGQKAVFHCGALSSPWGRARDFYRSNVIGTENVIAACHKHDIQRLIHVSTPSLCFYFDERFDVKEDDPLPSRFVNHYAKTKYLAEQRVDDAYQKGLPVITIRPRALFGPGDTTILPRLIAANQRRFIPLIDGGDIHIDLTYIDNAVDALLLCESAPSSCLGRKYHITNGEPVLLREMLEQLFQKLEMPFQSRPVSYTQAFYLAQALEWIALSLPWIKEPAFTRYTVSILGKSQTLNIERARSELGYQPRISIAEGVDRFVQWQRKHS
ncbi:nucleoside-diphosphate-sugar epimerase [Desmospora activa DSM 45169]|uniref:Nucleoside-diphosphate-sugar epimerase n=1 Tax=Desmospora activa DSM 45169 TaxID=1121389 RepID=A0A2T4ZDA8_9BACL|nr:nucleoside-diphosphate-sugar epimerase [Desmospora activa DSM 45169]